jgi:hypothetical protein
MERDPVRERQRPTSRRLPVAVVRPRDAVHWTLYYPAVIDFKPGDFAVW